MQVNLFAALTWAVCAYASAIDLLKRDTPLQVELEAVDNSKVKVVITNTDTRGYNLFYKGSFLDGDAPVDKFTVQGSASRATFNGVLLRMATTNLETYDFLPIQPGQAIETEVDVAEIYDVESSDSYVVRATGSMPYADLNSTTLTGKAVAYTSNALAMDIDGDLAKKVPYAIHALTPTKRTDLSCSSSRRTAISTALSHCADLAQTAATAARAGQQLREYFKTDSQSAANSISARFTAIAQECGSTSAGQTQTACTDDYGYCQPGVLAYTIPAYNRVAYCDIFYDSLPPLSSQCHDQDQATTVLHELTHAPAVYAPGTEDYAYGFEAAQALTSREAVGNADSYALYANALYVGC